MFLEEGAFPYMLGQVTSLKICTSLIELTIDIEFIELCLHRNQALESLKQAEADGVHKTRCGTVYIQLR